MARKRATSGDQKSEIKKGSWTPEEDRKLIDYITRYGYWNWRQLPKFAGLSRCGKSCRLRWMNYLRPDLKRGNFTEEEEELIIKLHEALGNKWSAIAAHLPGRTDNEIKNQWHTYLKKRLPQTSSSKENPNVPSKDNNEEERSEEADENSSLNHSTQEMFEGSSMTEISPVAAEPGNFTTENDVSSSDMFAELSGDFWTEPFLADNFDHHDFGFLSYPFSPLIGEELLYSDSFCDNEYNDLFSW